MHTNFTYDQCIAIIISGSMCNMTSEEVSPHQLYLQCFGLLERLLGNIFALPTDVAIKQCRLFKYWDELVKASVKNVAEFSCILLVNIYLNKYVILWAERFRAAGNREELIGLLKDEITDLRRKSNQITGHGNNHAHPNTLLSSVTSQVVNIPNQSY